MLKDTEETMGLSLFLSLAAFQSGGGPPVLPSYAYDAEQVDATQTYHKQEPPPDNVSDFLGKK